MKIKGRDLYKELPFKNALMERTERGKATRILLQSPNSSFISENISKEFKWKSLDSYLHDHQNSLSVLSDTIFNFKEVVRLYDFDALFKLYIFDDDVYASIYTGTIGDQNRKDETNVWHLSRKNDPVSLAKFLEIYFESLWKQSKPINRINNKSTIFQRQSYVLFLPVIYKNINLFSKKQVVVRNQEFSPKKELHITIIGSELGKQIKEKISSNSALEDLILECISETDWSYELSNDLYLLAKEKELTTNKTEKKTIHTESIIQMVNVPALESFYKKMAAITEIEIRPRPAHITLYTLGDPQGIGVDSQIEFNEFNKAKIGVDEIKNSM